MFAANLTVGSFFSAQALFAFAYMGVTIYLEIISEMKEPAEFRYSLLRLSGALLLFCSLDFVGKEGLNLILQKNQCRPCAVFSLSVDRGVGLCLSR